MTHLRFLKEPEYSIHAIEVNIFVSGQIGYVIVRSVEDVNHPNTLDIRSKDL